MFSNETVRQKHDQECFEVFEHHIKKKLPWFNKLNSKYTIDCIICINDTKKDCTSIS
jgi:hypothetical protein